MKSEAVCASCDYLTKDQVGGRCVCWCGHPNQMHIIRLCMARGRKSEAGIIKSTPDGRVLLKWAPHFCPIRDQERKRGNYIDHKQISCKKSPAAER